MPSPKNKGKLPPPPSPIPPDDELWKCEDGRVLRVGEMSEDHVRAALRMILRTRRRQRALRRELLRIASMDDGNFWDYKP